MTTEKGYLTNTEKLMDEHYGMNPTNAYMRYDDWYNYLINMFIIEQGEEDMGVFIDLGFNPTAYMIWKLAKKSIFKNPELSKAIIDKVNNLKFKDSK
jgi:hypothetical protein